MPRVRRVILPPEQTPTASPHHAGDGTPPPAGYQICSQCKRCVPLKDFPVRRTTLLPYLVCKTHHWYWTEPKKQIHWAPDYDSTLEQVCAEVEQPPDAGWVISGAEEDLKQIVGRIEHAGKWSAKPLLVHHSNITLRYPADAHPSSSVRKSRAKPQPGPPPPATHSFKLIPQASFLFSKPEDAEFEDLRLTLTFHPDHDRWAITLKPEAPVAGQGPWREARVQRKADKPKSKTAVLKEERAARKAMREEAKAASGGKRVRIRVRKTRRILQPPPEDGEGTEDEVDTTSSSSGDEAVEDPTADLRVNLLVSGRIRGGKRRRIPVPPLERRDEDEQAADNLPGAAETLLALALGGSPAQSRVQADALNPAFTSALGHPHGPARQLLQVALENLASSPAQLLAAAPSSSEQPFAYARTEHEGMSSTHNSLLPPAPRRNSLAPPKPKRARPTLIHHGPPPERPTVWPPPAPQPSIVQLAASFVQAGGMAGAVSGSRRGAAGATPLSLGQLLASPYLEPPVLPPRLMKVSLSRATLGAMLKTDPFFFAETPRGRIRKRRPRHRGRPRLGRGWRVRRGAHRERGRRGEHPRLGRGGGRG